MNRRGFFRRIGGLFAGGFLARWFPAKPTWIGEDAAVGLPAGLPITITQRKLMARICITEEVMNDWYPGAFARAQASELAGVLDDLDPPRGQHCIWGSLKRGGTFLDYERWHQARG